MQIDVTQPILTIYGQPVMADGEPITFKKVFLQALTEPVIGADGRPENMPSSEKIDRMMIAHKVLSADLMVSLTVDEAKKIKDAVNKMFPGPLIFFRVHEVIEAASSGPKRLKAAS